MDIDVAKFWNEMAWHHVNICEVDSWCVHAASHTSDPAGLLGKHLWCCLTDTENMASLFASQLCKIQINLPAQKSVLKFDPNGLIHHKWSEHWFR